MKKLQAILLLYFLGFFGACCDDQVKYITQITRIELEPKTSVIEANEVFEFRLIPRDSILYTAQQLNLGLIQSASAFKCDESDIYEPKESLVNIQANVLTDFSNQHQAGSNINDLVNVRFYNWRSQKIENYNLNQFINFVKNDSGSSTRKIAEVANATYQIAQKPESQNIQRFRIIFEFSDNSTLITDSEEVIWK